SALTAATEPWMLRRRRADPRTSPYARVSKFVHGASRARRSRQPDPPVGAERPDIRETVANRDDLCRERRRFLIEPPGGFVARRRACRLRGLGRSYAGAAGLRGSWGLPSSFAVW